MCSLNDENESCEPLELREKPLINVNSPCRSCSNKGLVVLRRKDVYCKTCFLRTETHKFRAALGKSKMMKPQDRVLVAYSGSQSSACLLHLLHSGVTEDQHKKLLFSVFVLFIDEGAIFNMEIDERDEIIQKIKNKVSVYNFPIYISSLGDYFKEPHILNSSLIIDKDSDKKIFELFENVKSFSSKEDLLCLIKQKLILETAQLLNCNKVFTAEVGTNIAVKLLSSFSLGRGATASFQTGFCDSRHPFVNILRPLRDFTKKEIIFYNKFYNIESETTPSLTMKSLSNVSIQKLTEKFVTDLHEGFPSTVYTIFRTGEKLSASVVHEINDDVCVLCNDKMRTPKGRNNYTAVEAATFSRNISSKKGSICEMKQENNCCGICSKEKEVCEIDTLEFEKFLCYGCTLIARDMKNVNVLPKNVLQAAVQKNNFEAMKEQICEFLIENSSEGGV